MNPHAIAQKKIFGREYEITLLRDKINSLLELKDFREFLIVTGSPGIGKTAFIDSVLQELLLSDFFIISGKHNELSADTPYLGFVDALSNLNTQFNLLGRDERRELLNRLTGTDKGGEDVYGEVNEDNGNG